jgi:two-component system LytT family sensor kinase
MGTIKLYEAKNRLFSSINRTLGRGLHSCFRRRSWPGNMSGKRRS